MKLEFLKQNNFPNLTLIFVGWGMSAADFRFLNEHESDLLVCSDYRTLDFDFEMLKSYRKIQLIGYSLGVWAASFIFREKQIPFSEKIAINGTQYPVDNERGIPVKIFEGTEKMLTEDSLQKFMLRMCGTKENFDIFKANTKEKNITHLKEELRTIQQLSAQYDVSDFRWNEAIVATKDAIFPFNNQLNAWNATDTDVCEVYMPHFAQEIFSSLVP